MHGDTNSPAHAGTPHPRTPRPRHTRGDTGTRRHLNTPKSDCPHHHHHPTLLNCPRPGGCQAASPVPPSQPRSGHVCAAHVPAGGDLPGGLAAAWAPGLTCFWQGPRWGQGLGDAAERVWVCPPVSPVSPTVLQLWGFNCRAGRAPPPTAGNRSWFNRMAKHPYCRGFGCAINSLEARLAVGPGRERWSPMWDLARLRWMGMALWDIQRFMGYGWLHRTSMAPWDMDGSMGLS